MPPPYIFYYKNNFTVSCYSNSMYNAIIDYAARNNIKAENALVRWGAIEMRLDEKGAEALLKNKREYETRRVETLGTKDTLDAMLIQSKNKDEKYLLIVDKKAKEKQAKFTACLNKEDNKIRVSDIFNWITNKEDETFMENMLKEAAKSLGAENYYIEEN